MKICKTLEKKKIHINDLKVLLLDILNLDLDFWIFQAFSRCRQNHGDKLQYIQGVRKWSVPFENVIVAKLLNILT